MMPSADPQAWDAQDAQPQAWQQLEEAWAEEESRDPDGWEPGRGRRPVSGRGPHRHQVTAGGPARR